jgi:5-formyltetrahydrofolate cyclo-ligase
MNNMAKRQLRKFLLQQRLSIPPAVRPGYDTAIRSRVLALPEVRDAACIFCFISFADEVDTHDLIRELQRQQKMIVVPKTLASGRLAAIPLGPWDDLSPDSFGILVPSASLPYAGIIDTCLTPGLGFSPSGQRLGYGRGYYDSWFAHHRVAHKIGIGYECQMLDQVPMDETDVYLDKIVTERGIYDAEYPRLRTPDPRQP